MISLSFSACTKYLLSPRAYYLHYIRRIRPIQQSSALLFGTALDTAINSLLTDLKDGKGADLGKAQAIFRQSFSTVKVDGEERFLWDDGVVKYSKADYDESLIPDAEKGLPCPAWRSLRVKGEIILEEYYQQVLPKIKKVLYVQHPIEVVNQDGDKFTGVVDLIATMDDDKTYVLDNKSTSKAYTENSANESEQLQTYFEILKDQMKLDGVGFIAYSKTVLKKKLPRVNIQVIYGKYNEELVDKTFEKYDTVLEGIKLGKYDCTKECCKTYFACPYKQYCDSNGKDLTGLKMFKATER